MVKKRHIYSVGNSLGVLVPQDLFDFVIDGRMGEIFPRCKVGTLEKRGRLRSNEKRGIGFLATFSGKQGIVVVCFGSRRAALVVGSALGRAPTAGHRTTHRKLSLFLSEQFSASSPAQ
jgi:hypothetical protein